MQNIKERIWKICVLQIEVHLPILTNFNNDTTSLQDSILFAAEM